MDPEDLDVNAAATPSDAADDLDVNGQPGQPEASSAPVQGEDKDILSILEDAVKAPPVDGETPPVAATPAADAAKPAPTGAEAPFDPEKDNGPVPYARFKQVNDKLKAADTDATQFRKQVEFCDQHGITGDEMNKTFEIAARIKSDPEGALAMLQPVYLELLKRNGLILAEDLKSDVMAGKVTQERALEISKARAREANSNVQQSLARQRQEQQQSTPMPVDRLRAVTSSWEERMKLRDPDYASKVGSIMAELKYRIQVDGTPGSPAALAKVLDDIHAGVTPVRAAPTPAPGAPAAPRAANGQFVPTPAPARQKPAVTPVSGGRSGAGGKPVPTSMEDVVRQAVGAA